MSLSPSASKTKWPPIFSSFPYLMPIFPLHSCRTPQHESFSGTSIIRYLKTLYLWFYLCRTDIGWWQHSLTNERPVFCWPHSFISAPFAWYLDQANTKKLDRVRGTILNGAAQRKKTRQAGLELCRGKRGNGYWFSLPVMFETSQTKCRPLIVGCVVVRVICVG